jgi:hypothetical protein
MSIVGYGRDVDGPITRTMAVASMIGCVLVGNMKILMPTIPITLMTRTSMIAFASGVRGLAPATKKAVSEDKIAATGEPSRRTC